MRRAASPARGGRALIACLCLALLTAASGHVQLSYPPSISVLDFLDNVRTAGLCGDEASGADNSGYWRVPDVDNNTVTTLEAGGEVNATWNLHYMHQGGWRFELFDRNGDMVATWNDSSHWGCNHDGTQQWVVLNLPRKRCRGCILRLVRQALEWGPSYLFHSCAMVDIERSNDTNAACNGCSGHGECVEGLCKCDNSPKKGFWEGTYCERQNECDDDSHCGEGGMCIDIGATTPPRKQCYCKEGWFGDEVTPWAPGSQLPTRLCNRRSSLEIGNPDDWDEEYPNKKTSAGTGAFAVYYKVDEEAEEIEFAIKANTDNWVGLGFRAAQIVGVPRPDFAQLSSTGSAEPAADSEGSASESEPTTGMPPLDKEMEDYEGKDDKKKDKEAETAAEGEPSVQAEAEPAKEKEDDYEGKDHKKKDNETETAAEGEPSAQAEAEPAKEKKEDDYEGKDNKKKDNETETVAEGEPATQAEAEPTAVAEGEPATQAEAEPTAVAEGEPVANAEGDAGSGICTPGDPSVVTSDDGVFLNRGNNGKRRLASMYQMPEIEAEASDIEIARLTKFDLQMFGRHLAQSEAEPTATGEAEPTAAAEGASTGEPPVGSPGALALTYFGPPKCRNPLVDNPAAHPMINQDIVIGYARGNAFRIQDSFTPSRARPLPDVYFGGQDDILDAVGKEENGVTYLKYRRKLQTDDQPGDYCVIKETLYLMIYAYGQPAGNYTHIPDSSFETGRASNQNFYGRDELKFHGGGIGTSYEGRGVLGQVDFFQVPSDSDSGCEMSTLEGFDCMREIIPSTYYLHWTLEDEGVRLAGETMGTGWVSIAWPESPGQMIGSHAVIGWTGGSGDKIEIYRLDGKSEDMVVEAPDAFAIAEPSIEEVGGKTVLQFTRVFDDNFARDDAHDLLVAYGAVDDIAYHGASAKSSLTLNFVTGGSSVAEAEDLTNYWRVHGILMTIGWGMLLPLGIIIARTMKDQNPLWFYLHIVCNTAGLIIAVGGFVLALIKFEREDVFRHRQVGIAAMILGLVQPFNAAIRPHHGHPYRNQWEWIHWTTGRAALVLAIWNIFTGLDEYDFLTEVGSKKYHVAFGSWLMALFLVYLTAEGRSQRIAHSKDKKEVQDRLVLLEKLSGVHRNQKEAADGNVVTGKAVDNGKHTINPARLASDASAAPLKLAEEGSSTEVPEVTPPTNRE